MDSSDVALSLCGFFGLKAGKILWDYVSIYVCFYDTSVLASMTHLWATIRGISLPVTNCLSSDVQHHCYH
jgi:hypothetical protein